ncbi:cell division protein ZapE [Castellaniella caeni]|uniref:cell division protein ZapE n=1 Tax=Castellaniella caeni TaxID=266123 RepID=UPI000835D3C3|nr:cell division protein ZapE [Castellaniella caeni]
MDVSAYYAQALRERGFVADEAQHAAVERLQQYYDDWIEFKRQRSTRLKKLFLHPDVPRGVYLWGGVGRGKSFLMDAFYLTVPVKRKVRLHFHEFMRGVHKEIRAVSGEADPLDHVASTIAKRYRLICFDEFHVSDVADAMILYRLLLKLFEYGTSFVMTSNYEPSTLYPDGLHRDRILPAIELIQQKMDVLNVDAGIDYRRRTLAQLRTYITPIVAATHDELRAAFTRLADTAEQKPVLLIEDREIQAIALAGTVVWFDFEALCGTPRSQNDYLDLADRFQTIIVSDVPQMAPRQASEARRFTWLVDVLYDHKVKLILSAQCPADALYTQGPMSNEFSRTVSRLMEMQSREYLAETRRALVDL